MIQRQCIEAECSVGLEDGLPLDFRHACMHRETQLTDCVEFSVESSSPDGT